MPYVRHPPTEHRSNNHTLTWYEMTTSLLIATHNPGKLSELSELLADTGLLVTGASEAGLSDVEETGLTFVENAILKARAACAEANMPALADDSGLEVDFLGGAPGIYSARYAADSVPPGGDRKTLDGANIDKLLQALEGVPHAQRSARFRCTLVVMRHASDPAPLICEGQWEGHIATKRKGENGFGYDPVFLPHDAIGSAAQLSSLQKHQLSHRALALKLLKQHIRRFLEHSKD